MNLAKTFFPVGLTKRFIVIGFALGLLLHSAVSVAQLATTGTITGTVTDESGALLPGASVNIRNAGTSVVTHTVSNSAGSFSQVGLEPGHYELTVTHTGFKSFNQVGIYLQPAATYTVKAGMQPGEVNTTVTVQGSAVQVETSTSEISSTVTGEEAEALPLNGRNYQGLGSLMPGVINTSPISPMGAGGFNTSNALNVNGGGSSGSFYTLDGIWNENSGNETQTTIMPNPDSIEEMRVLQNNYDAKYSLMGASVVIVQTKSGTETFHGGAWEFVRNTIFDSRNYFVRPPTPLPAEGWNTYGFQIGGPLFIPHLYNRNNQKTFFYLNQQWVNQKQQSVATGATPTAFMRGIGNSGNALFPLPGSGSPYVTSANGGYLKDPAKTTPCNASNQSGCFPGNVIPASRINVSNLALLNAMAPLPNNQGATFTNYLNTRPSLIHQPDLEVKVNHNLSPRFRLMAEYFYEGGTTNLPNAQRMGSPFATNWDIFKTDNQLAQVSLTQMLSASMANQTSVSMNNYDITHDFAGLNSISQVSGYAQSFPYSGGYLQDRLPHVTFTGGWSQFGTSANNTIPRATDLENTVTDDWSWLHGNHFIEAGGSVLWGSKRQWATGLNTTGDASFNGQVTGSPIADYLLGYANTFGQGSDGIRKHIQYPIDTLYVEDQWKVSRRLTVTAGVRWLYMPFPHTQAGYMDDFDPAKFNPANAPAILPNGNIDTQTTPVYDATNGMIFNGKNGVPINLTNANKNYWAPTAGFALDVFGDGRTSFRGGFSLTHNRNGGMGAACSQGCVSYPVVQQVNLLNTTFPNPTTAGTPAPLTASTVAGQTLDYKIGGIKTYSLSLQQQIGSSWFLSIAGAGDMARNLQASVNINQPASVPGYDFNPALNTGNYSNSYFAPYKGYNVINFSQPVGIDNWNALEVGLRHPVGHNVYVTVAYTWSHNLDNTGGFQNIYNLASAYGNSSLNTPHVFTSSVIYTVPWFREARGWKQVMLGGWKYSDMTSIYSGNSLTLGLSTSHTGLATHPDQVALVTYPKALNQWFSTASFVQPAAGFFGKVGNGTLTGPGLIDFNMSLYKDFPIYERLKLQFRSEFFNVFNHPNPNAPNTSVGAGNYGQITSAKDPRIGEMAVKLIF